jgi:uncharacterized protein YjlB
MSIVESMKKSFEELTRRAKPSADEARRLVRARKAHAHRFEDDGLVPNNPTLPMIVYQGAVHLDEAYDPAAIFEVLFAANRWDDSWRDGVYDFLHYHSAIHEVLGVARGHAKVRFGGNGGRALNVKAGDVAILAAGTGHQRLSASQDFLVVGAYPPTGKYDLRRATREDHDGAVKAIARTVPPKTDPVYGADGPLIREWKVTAR